MKKILLILCLFFVANAIQAQGIKFENSFPEALAKAKSENKRIFIDFHTQWCGPCKEMAKNTFTLKEVGDYFNKNYISLKIDAEKGEGVQLAKKYGVTSYPTLVFLDSQGDFLYKEVGAAQPERLIAWASQNKNSKFLDPYKKEFESGTMTAPRLKEYLDGLIGAGLSGMTILEKYFVALPEDQRYSNEIFSYLRKCNVQPNDELFNTLLNQRDKFIKGGVNDWTYDSFLFIRCLFQAYRNPEMGIDNALYFDKLEQSTWHYIKYVREAHACVMLLNKPENSQSFIDRTTKLFVECPVSIRYVCNEGIKNGWGKNELIEAYMNKTIDEYAKMKPVEAASLYSNYTTLYLINAQNYEKANELMDKAIKCSGDPNFEHETVLYIKRNLGLEKCENYGKQAPDFNLPTPDGKQISLSQLKGKYVLIDFWASWCGPCKGEIPYLKAAYEKYSDKGLIVLSITSDRDDVQWKQAIEKEQMKWSQVTANQTDILNKYEVSGIPRIMIIDPDGKFFADELRGAAIERELSKIFN